MRYSSFDKSNYTKPVQESASNEEFFRAALKAADKVTRPGAILLVGGNDTRSLTIRNSQAAVRFDRRPSYWSHAAIMLAWDDKDIGKSTGLEVTLSPEAPHEQVPERNAVTRFQLGRYFDRTCYPNAALCFVGFPVSEETDPRARLLQATLNPNQDRERYPFWDLLARWASFALEPLARSNLLLDNVPLPAASFCEYVYEAAGIDLTPGATGNYCCPEVLHATLLHWKEGLERSDGVTLQSSAVIRDEFGKPRPALSVCFDELEGLLPAPATAPERPPTTSARKRAPRRR